MVNISFKVSFLQTYSHISDRKLTKINADTVWNKLKQISKDNGYIKT